MRSLTPVFDRHRPVFVPFLSFDVRHLGAEPPVITGDIHRHRLAGHVNRRAYYRVSYDMMPQACTESTTQITRLLMWTYLLLVCIYLCDFEDGPLTHVGAISPFCLALIAGDCDMIIKAGLPLIKVSKVSSRGM